MRENGFLIICIMIIALLTAFLYMKQPPRDRIFINGNVLTMNDNNTIEEAVAVRRGKIFAVGTNEEIKKDVRRGTIVTDLKGRTLIPGFIDAHSHFPTSGLLPFIAVDLNSPPIGRIRSIPELISVLRDKAASTRKGNKIVGLGYDDTLLKEKRHPTRHDLDAASRDHPIYISHVSGHYAVLNSMALKDAGIYRSTKDPEGGSIHRDPATGEPDGILEESATRLAYEKGTHFSVLEKLRIIRTAVSEYSAAGVTTAQNGLTETDIIKPLSYMSRAGLIPIRLVVWPSEKAAEDIIKNKISPKKLDTAEFHVGAVKLFADGSIQAYTAFLSEPYHTPHNNNAEYRGYPVRSSEEIARLVSKYHSAGFQIAIHGNGDAAIDIILNAVNQAIRSHPRSDHRHILVHGQTARPDQIDTMKKLGMTPSYHAVHPYYWGDRHRDVFLGNERTLHISPLKTTSDKKLRFSIHLDSPVVPMSPLFLVWRAVNRISSSGKAIGPDERISPMLALRAVTIDAAWQIFQENNRGSIEPGKFADLAIISDSPIINPLRIKDIKVLETIVSGRSVYRSSLQK